MNPQELNFQELFTTGAWVAVAPLCAIGIGILGLLVTEVIEGLRSFRPLVFLAALVAAAVFELRILAGPESLALEHNLVLDGTLAANATSAIWGLVFLVGTGLAWAFSHGFYSGSEERFKDEHDVLMLCCPLGMMLMASAQELVLFFIGLEVLSIPLYVLAAYQRNRAASVEAGLKYFLLGAFGSALFVYGAALFYAAEGTLSLSVLRGTYESSAAGPLALAGLGLIAASLFFKMSVFPFHLWVPDVYQGSPTPVTALMAAGTKGAAIAFLLNIAFLMPGGAAEIVAVIGVVTMAIGYLGALVQEDTKRMLAYSGIASAGTILLVVAGVLKNGAELQGAQTAALYYMGAYVFAITGAFGLIAMLERQDARFTRLSSLRGLAKTRPGVAAAMSLFVLSLGGIPATGGFLGKWFVFAVLVRADGLIAFAVIGALLSVIALAFYLRIIIAMWMQPADSGAPTADERPLVSGLATALCAAGVLATGLLPGLFLPG